MRCDSRATPLESLLATKAILLAPGFNHSEHRGLGAQIEHLNRETGRCNSSLERLAALLRMSVRQVEPAVEGLGRAIRYRRRDLVAWVRANTVRSGHPSPDA